MGSLDKLKYKGLQIQGATEKKGPMAQKCSLKPIRLLKEIRFPQISNRRLLKFRIELWTQSESVCISLCFYFSFDRLWVQFDWVSYIWKLEIYYCGLLVITLISSAKFEVYAWWVFFWGGYPISIFSFKLVFEIVFWKWY